MPMVEVSCLNIFLKNILFSFFQFMSYILVYWKSNLGEGTTAEKKIVQTKLSRMQTLSSIVSFVKFYFLVEF